MRHIFFSLCCFVLIPNALRADQTDPRLDNLFAAMADATNEHQSVQAEQQIWEIWLQHGDAEIQERFDKGVAAMDRDPALALALLTNLTIDVPEFAEVWNKRATLFYILGDYDASLADIDETLALEPRHFGALSGLGLVYMAKGEHARALAAFEAVLEIQPQSQVTRRNIKQIDNILGRQAI